MSAGDYNTQTGAKNKYNTVTGKLVGSSSSSSGSSSGSSTPTVKPANDPSNKYNTTTGAINTNYSGYVAPSSGGGGGSSPSVINIDSNPGQTLAPGQVYTYKGVTYTQPGGVTTPVATPTTPISSANLKVGSTGQSVIDLQKQLGITADGIFGPQTQAAVKAYQTANGLVSDGIVGTNTAGKMNGGYVAPSNILPTDTLGNNPKVTLPDQPLATDYSGLLNGLNGTNVNDTANAGIDVNTQNNANILQQFQDLIGTPPSTADSYAKAQEQTGILKAQQERNDLSANLNQIVAQGQAASVTLEQQSGGKGVTSAFLGRQQQEISRQTAIQALPVSAQLQAAQGNLETATQNLNTLFKIYSDDATNAYNYRVQIATAFKEVATSAENKKLDLFLNQITAQQNQTLADIKMKQDLAITATQNGASASIITAIANAPDFNSALTAAGTSLAASSNEIIDVGGNKMLVNKITGKVIKSYGGATPTDNPTSIPIIRTVTTPDGKKAPVDGYTLSAGDDPYFIAQKNGLDMQGLKDLNPNVKDWNNLQIGAVINVPNKTTGSGSILAVTGLSMPAFQFLTIGQTALTRMSSDLRIKYMNEAENYVNRTGTDVATFRSQYSALSSTVEANVLRNNQSAVAEAEIDATLQNLKSASDDASFKGMRWANVVKMFAGKEFNDANVSKYAFHLNQLREEFAMYNMALAGQLDANGNIREINEGDRIVAEQIIKDGFAKGSIDGFESALTASRSKMQTVLQASINAQNKQVWNLFGVGDQYEAKTTPVDPLVSIQNYGNTHPEQQNQLTQMNLDGLTVESINNWINQQI